MTDALFSEMLSKLLADTPQISWHEELRREIGIPEECDEEAILSLVVQRVGRNSAARPIAFVLEPYQLRNTLIAVGEFMREAFHPVVGGHGDVLAVIDYMPALDKFGYSSGVVRRWVVDKTNYQLLLPEISSYITVIAG